MYSCRRGVDFNTHVTKKVRPNLVGELRSLPCSSSLSVRMPMSPIRPDGSFTPKQPTRYSLCPVLATCDAHAKACVPPYPLTAAQSLLPSVIHTIPRYVHPIAPNALHTNTWHRKSSSCLPFHALHPGGSPQSPSPHIDNLAKTSTVISTCTQHISSRNPHQQGGTGLPCTCCTSRLSLPYFIRWRS